MEEKRLSTLSMCLKAADIGHAAKEIDLHMLWTRMITNEFYRQGDLELKKGMQVSAVCDRN